MQWIRLAALAGLAVVACGGSSSSTIDAAVPDGPLAIDAPPPAIDVSPGAPDAAIDAEAPAIDASAIDASPIDASPPDAMPGDECDGVGDPCATTCPDALMCYVGGGGGVCAPMRPGCG